jgi:hypothetical protein
MSFALAFAFTKLPLVCSFHFSCDSKYTQLFFLHRCPRSGRCHFMSHRKCHSFLPRLLCRPFLVRVTLNLALSRSFFKDINAFLVVVLSHLPIYMMFFPACYVLRRLLRLLLIAAHSRWATKGDNCIVLLASHMMGRFVLVIQHYSTKLTFLHRYQRRTGTITFTRLSRHVSCVYAFCSPTSPTDEALSG